ncbi:MAG: hypothetical protein ACJ74A_05450 [Gaiellaceae bacterium]
MAVTGELERVWRRTLEAYVDYTRSLGRLTADYARALAGTAAELRPRQPGGVRPTTRQPTAARTTMALEAEAGSVAVGMFVVENSGSSAVSGTIELTKLADSEGHEVQPGIGFEPDRVTLQPGEQTVVQASVQIDRSLRAGIDYRGEVRVPGPPGTTVPLVVRRLASRRRPAAKRTG